MDIKMMAFNLVKNMIVQQNKDLIERISDEYGLDKEDMLREYLKPEFYLVVFEKEVTKKHDRECPAAPHAIPATSKPSAIAT